MSTVKVRIYGQEYTISGDKSREYIMKVADHVDQNMHELGQVFPGTPVSSLAVLASVNIADAYFETAARLAAQEEMCGRKEEELARYITLWEEAKRNFLLLKEENEKLTAKTEELREAASGEEKQLAEAEKKVKEAESNFFDLQRENIRLKSEIERLRRTQDSF